jgi:hypothetical protein
MPYRCGGCVAVTTREQDVFDLALTANTQVDHFPDVGKMVCNAMTGHLASHFCLNDYIDKVLPFGVAQQVLNIASQAGAASVMVQKACFCRQLSYQCRHRRYVK